MSTAYRKIFIFYTACIILLTLLPVNGLHAVLNNTYVIELRLDYLLHALLYIPFIFLFNKAFQRSFTLAIITGLLFATLSEGAQYFLPYRAFNINDLLANNIGIFAGSVAYLLKH